jgi:hypothetical protein
MGKERLKRIIVLLLVAVFFFFAGKVFANWFNKKKAVSASLGLSTQQIENKISDLGEQVLGKAIGVIPGGNNLKEKLMPTLTPTPLSSQTVTETTTQTIEVETKTQEIIQIIKELPAAELDNIKKQVFKDFCQKVMGE